MIPIDLPTPVLTFVAGALAGIILGGAIGIAVEFRAARRRKRDGSP